jgi:hypothetical protein
MAALQKIYFVQARMKVGKVYAWRLRWTTYEWREQFRSHRYN